MTATAVRERPILFSGEMVRAILDGRKTQTRRTVSDSTSRGNFRASEMLLDDPRVFVDPGPSPAGNPGPYLKAPINVPAICERRGGTAEEWDAAVVERLYPAWFADDHLWVKETFSPCVCDACRKAWPREGKPGHGVNYRATDDRPDYVYRPSIFMPRWASRLTLAITDVRVERLREISGSDAVAEGLSPTMRNEATAVDRFSDLWDSLNAKRGYGWASNPWVWAIAFAPLSGASPARQTEGGA